MFINVPLFYYWLFFQSLVDYVSGAVVFIPIYLKLNQENYKRNLRIVALGWYGINTVLGLLGFSMYKYVYHQIPPLYLLLWGALSIIAFTAFLGFMYAGITPSFFANPYKLKTSKVAVGMLISLIGIVLAITVFL